MKRRMKRQEAGQHRPPQHQPRCGQQKKRIGSARVANPVNFQAVSSDSEDEGERQRLMQHRRDKASVAAGEDPGPAAHGNRRWLKPSWPSRYCVTASGSRSIMTGSKTAPCPWVSWRPQWAFLTSCWCSCCMRTRASAHRTSSGPRSPGSRESRPCGSGLGPTSPLAAWVTGVLSAPSRRERRLWRRRPSSGGRRGSGAEATPRGGERRGDDGWIRF